MSKEVSNIVFSVVVLCLVAFGGYYYYKQYSSSASFDKSVLYVVDMETILDQKHKELYEAITSGKIGNQQEAISQLDSYKKRVKAVILSFSKKNEVPVYDKRIVISYNQKDITNTILAGLKKDDK